jgi:hypothetical protein
MTLGKASALVAALLGAMALGVWIGPHITDRDLFSAARSSADRPSVQRTETERASQAAETRRTPTAKRTTAKRAPAAAVSTSAPELHARLKPLMNRGTDMALASEGFRNAEQFAMVAHAAKNTNVPFVLLKHRVLTEGKTLTAAIRESKPDLNAASEVNKARAAARSDLTAL